jgi:hypothetical protein
VSPANFDIARAGDGYRQIERGIQRLKFRAEGSRSVGPSGSRLLPSKHQHVPRDRSAILELNSHGEIVAITIDRDVDILERCGARSEQAGGRASCRD